MLTRRAPFVALVSVVIMLGTSGCFASSPAPAPSTSAAPAASPLFASDEEALAAATEAYAAYLAASNSVGKNGWSDLEQIRPLVTEEALIADVALAENYRAQGYVQKGDSTFDSLAIQSVESDGASAYLCLDASQADLVDANGVSVVDLNQPRRVPLQVDFVSSADQSLDLLVGRSEVWTGKNFC